jgi:hypothetical protein
VASPDSETDPTLRATVKQEYKEGMQSIKSKAMFMTTNRANDFKRKEPARLLSEIAKKHNLNDEQVKRIVNARK